MIGEVRDQKDGSPLANVLIQIQDYSYSGYSNTRGIFQIENLSPGNYNISFSLVGYQTKYIHQVTVLEDIPQKILVQLEQKILSTEPILIEDDWIEKSTDISGDKIIINVQKEKDQGFNNLTQILQQVAGLQVDSRGGSDSKTVVRIHGSDANQVLVLLDGNRLNNPQTGDVDLSEIPFSGIEKIEVIRHGNTAMYGGGAFAGIVKIQTVEKAESSYLSTNSKIASFMTYSGQISAGLAFENGFGRMTWFQDYSDQNFSYEYKDQNIERENAWYRNRNFFT
ncbi:TonB-dependent receptor plug domain-containing protein [Calditrichota bacterium]